MVKEGEGKCIRKKTIGEELTERSTLISKNAMEMKYQKIHFLHEDQEVIVLI